MILGPKPKQSHPGQHSEARSLQPSAATPGREATRGGTRWPTLRWGAQGRRAWGEGQKRRGWPGQRELSHARRVQGGRTRSGSLSLAGSLRLFWEALHTAQHLPGSETNPAQQQPRVNRVGSEQVLSSTELNSRTGERGSGGAGGGRGERAQPPAPRKTEKGRETSTRHSSEAAVGKTGFPARQAQAPTRARSSSESAHHPRPRVTHLYGRRPHRRIGHD